MSKPTQHRRRGGLLASTSLVAVSATLLGFGFVGMTPSAALAANECGNPATNGAAADTFNCPAGVYPTGIIYPLTAGDLTLNLVESAGGAVSTTTGGIQVVGAPGDDLTLTRSQTAVGSDDPSIINTLGAGINYLSTDSNIVLNLSDVDAGDTPIVVTGSTSGIVAATGLTGNVNVTLTNGTVTGQAGDGIMATAGTGGSATVAIGGASVSGTNTAVGMNAIGVGVSGGTGMTVTGTGNITATGNNYAFGIYAVGDGPIVINETGNIVAVGTYAWGVYTLGTAGSSITITTANVTANQPGGPLGGGDGISAYTTGAVTINSGIVNTTGLYADGIVVGGVGGIAGNTTIVSGAITTVGAQSDGIDVGAHGVIDITSGSIVTAGANSNGIEADSDLSNVVIRSTAISAAGAGSDGIHAAGQTGVTITTGGITAGARGIDASSAAGNVLITGTGGTIRANGGDGIDATATLGSATVNLGATNVNSTNAGALNNSYAVSVNGATGMTVTGTGSVTATGGNYAIGILAQGDGPIVINETGTITATGAYAWGIYTLGTAGGPITITSSNVVVNQPGGPLGGGDGIFAYTTGAVTINSSAVSTTGLSADGIFVGGTALSPFGIAGATNVTSASVVTTGGNSMGIRVGAHGPIVINSGTVSTSGVNSNGIQAATDLSTVNITSGAITATGVGSTGIRAIGQTGATVNANGNITANVNAINTTQNGVGAGTINIASAATVRGSGTSLAGATVHATTLSGQTTTINNAGVIRSTNATIAGAAGDLAIRGVGGNVIVNDSGRIDGRLDFTGLTGVNRATVNTTASGSWHTTGLTTFSAGNDTVNNAGLTATLGSTTFDFGADTGVAPRDVFNNSGKLVVGEATGASTLTMTGLETFNNSGGIYFGSVNGGASSDGETNDRLVMTATGGGTAFIGSGGSTLFMDANLGTATQTTCAAATVADCFSLPGGAVTGSNKIRITNTNAGPGGLNTTGIVLVDATGGSIASGALVIDPASANYVVRGGMGAIDTGLFNYRLVLQGTTKAALVSAPDSEVFEFAQFGTAATDAWYIGTGTWFDRQADLRNTVGSLDGANHGAVWMKIVGDRTERTESAEYVSLGTTLTYDTSYNQNTSAVIVGADLLGGGNASSTWVLGVDVGYIDSDVKFDASRTLVSMEGIIFGAYGSYVAGPWYVDATVSATNLDLNDSIPSLAGSSLTDISGNVTSLGFQAETGWRMPLGESTYWEPTASLAYVSTSFDDLTVPGGSVEFDDVTSLRGSLGLRLATTVTYPTWRMQPSVYVKVWDEFDGETGTTLNNPGLPIVMQDDFSGAFADVGGQVNIYSDGGLTAFVNAGYKWKDDYSATTVNLGFRYQF